MRVVCLSTGGHVDLVAGRSYRVIPDPKAEANGFVRVVDDSGEDYLYPARWFEALREI